MNICVCIDAILDQFDTCEFVCNKNHWFCNFTDNSVLYPNHLCQVKSSPTDCQTAIDDSMTVMTYCMPNFLLAQSVGDNINLACLDRCVQTASRRSIIQFAITRTVTQLSMFYTFFFTPTRHL